MKPQVECRTFEDNAACIKVAQSDHKIRPRTKYISVCLFHFRDHVEKGLITIEHVPSKYQLANIFTKPLPMINTCAYGIRSWGGCPLHLLNTRECEVVVGTTSNCLPTSVSVLPILLRAILYSLQYLYSFPPIVHLCYLTRCLHPYLLLSSIQLGVLFTYDYPNPPQYTIKYFVVNSIT